MATLAMDLDRPDVLDAPRRWKWTADVYERLIETGALADQRVELIAGDLIEVAPQYLPHARVKARLYDLFKARLALAKLTLEVLTEVTVRLNLANAPQPDIVVWTGGDVQGPIPADCIRLLVEVCDTTHHIDLSVKPPLYAGAGIPEYWVADLRARAITLFWSPGPDGYADARTVPFGSPALSPTLCVEIATEGLL